MKAKKKVLHVWCHYRGAWVPMGRARKKCPVCSAVFLTGDRGHRFKKMAVKG